MTPTHVQLSIKNDDFVAHWQNVVAAVTLEESEEHKIVQTICNINGTNNTSADKYRTNWKGLRWNW